MIEVPLTKGYVALIDDEDAERVLAYKWMVNVTKSGNIYGQRSLRNGGRKLTIMLHRFIMDAPDGLEVDHRDGNGLDNRRSNLRLATSSQNRINTTGRVSRTGYRGVRTDFHRFQAGIRCNRECHYIGSYGSAEEAARAYDAKARELHGEFARLNFPAEAQLDAETGQGELRSVRLAGVQPR